MEYVGRHFGGGRPGTGLQFRVAQCAEPAGAAVVLVVVRTVTVVGVLLPALAVIGVVVPTVAVVAVVGLVLSAVAAVTVIAIVTIVAPIVLAAAFQRIVVVVDGPACTRLRAGAGNLT